MIFGIWICGGICRDIRLDRINLLPLYNFLLRILLTLAYNTHLLFPQQLVGAVKFLEVMVRHLQH